MQLAQELLYAACSSTGTCETSSSPLLTCGCGKCDGGSDLRTTQEQQQDPSTGGCWSAEGLQADSDEGSGESPVEELSQPWQAPVPPLLQWLASADQSVNRHAAGIMAAVSRAWGCSSQSL